MILPRSLKCLVYISKMHTLRGGRRGHDRMVVEFKLPMQSVPITTNVVSSNPAHTRYYIM
jgi:hypothetical protein